MPKPDPSMSHKNAPLLPPDLMRKLDRLDVLARRVLPGTLHGQRPGKRKGQSIEFADYRPYAVGDDLRFIDWNLYARLDRLIVRLFMQEEDLSVSVLLDTTASMDWGLPNKLLYAKRLAAALGYVALARHHRVHLYSLTDRVADQLVNLRGRQPVPRMLTFLQSQTPDAAGSLDQACRRFASNQRQRGVVILVSDFLEKQGVTDALRHLTSKPNDVYAIQLLAPQEIHPDTGVIRGDLRLLDCEDGSSTEVFVDPALLKAYEAQLTAHRNQVFQACAKRGIVYMTGDTATPLDTLVLRYMRQTHLLG